MCDEFNERFLEPPMRSLATNSRNFACAIAKYIFFFFSFNFIFLFVKCCAILLNTD